MKTKVTRKEIKARYKNIILIRDLVPDMEKMFFKTSL
jgi:hypothetical protein